MDWSKLTGGVLDEILAPVSLATFLAKSWNRAVLYLPGPTGRFSTLFGWSSLSSLLERTCLQEPRINVVRRGKSVPADEYVKIAGGISRIDAGALTRLLAQGASLIVNYIDELEPAVAELADEIGNSLPAKVGVNLYAAWPGSSGFGLHWDRHDVLVLQIAGAKEWRVFAPTRVDPIEGDVFPQPEADAEPVWQGRLDDGDVLYIPRGWWHVAEVVEERPSLHLTIALTQATGAGYLRWLVDELTEEAAVRSSVPLAHGADVTTQWLSRLKDVLLAGMDDRSLTTYFERRSADQRARPRFSFPELTGRQPAQWDERTRFRLASGRSLILEEPGDGTMQAKGLALPLEGELAPALRKLSSMKSIGLADLASAVPPEKRTNLRRCLFFLMQAGLLFEEQG